MKPAKKDPKYGLKNVPLRPYPANLKIHNCKALQSPSEFCFEISNLRLSEILPHIIVPFPSSSLSPSFEFFLCVVLGMVVGFTIPVTVGNRW